VSPSADNDFIALTIPQVIHLQGQVGSLGTLGHGIQGSLYAVVLMGTPANPVGVEDVIIGCKGLLDNIQGKFIGTDAVTVGIIGGNIKSVGYRG